MRPDRPIADTVSVRGIQVHGFHGALPEERVSGQPFLVDLVVTLDTRRAAFTDDLQHAVNYAEITRVAHDVLAGPPCDLIETVAQNIADAVLADTRIAAVDVVVHKPQAPVGIDVDDVTVQIVRTRDDMAAIARPGQEQRAVLSLGSNLGDREATLAAAVRDLGQGRGMTVEAVSPVVETDPVGGPDQPPYLNAVVLVRTALSPMGVLMACREVEDMHQRRRTVRWGPRTLDVDVVAVGDAVLETSALVLPHPGAARRGFVLVPWLAADPGAELPGRYGPRPVAALLAGMSGPDGPTPGVRPRSDVILPGAAATAGT